MATSTRKTAKSATKAATKAGSTRSRSPASPKRKAPKAEPAAPATVVDAPAPVVLGPMMRKPELISAVVAKSGMKKKDVKPIVEATLAVLGAALQDSRELNLEPLGKVKVNREKKKATGKVMVARIRQSRDLPSEKAHPDPKDLGGTTTTPTAAE